MTNKILNTAEIVIRRIREAYDLKSDAAVARLLGASTARLAGWKSRDVVPFSLILEHCEDLNLDWLIRGYGNPRRHFIMRQYVEGDREFPVAQDDLHIPVLGRKRIGAKGPELIDSISSFGFTLREWILNNAFSEPEKAFITEVQGVGMSGVFENGDLVLGLRQDEIDQEGIYAVWLAGGIIIRNVHLIAGKVVLAGSNNEYPSHTVIPGDDFQVVGRIYGGITHLLS